MYVQNSCSGWKKADGDGLLIPGNLVKPEPRFWRRLFGRANKLFPELRTLSEIINECIWNDYLLPHKDDTYENG